MNKLSLLNMPTMINPKTFFKSHNSDDFKNSNYKFLGFKNNEMQAISSHKLFESDQERRERCVKNLRNKIDEIARQIGEINQADYDPQESFDDKDFEFRKELLIERMEDFFDETCNSRKGCF